MYCYQDTGKNLLFAVYKIGNTALSLMFLEHWRLHFGDWRYGCQNTSKIFYSQALKSGVRNNILFLEHWVFLHQLVVRLQKYGQKLLFPGFEIGFAALSVHFLEHCLFCVDWRYISPETG